MKKTLFTLFVLFTLQTSAQKFTFTLYSQSVGGQATAKQVFNGFGCKGDNISPDLYWKNAPEGTKSFAMTMFDENAPTASGWWHWIVFNIDKNVTQLKAGAGDLSKALAPANCIQSKTDFGLPGYGGPCPPAAGGIHRYVITVYALKTEKVDADVNSTPAFVSYLLEANAIQKASIIFYYKN